MRKECESISIDNKMSKMNIKVINWRGWINTWITTGAITRNSVLKKREKFYLILVSWMKDPNQMMRRREWSLYLYTGCAISIGSWRIFHIRDSRPSKVAWICKQISAPKSRLVNESCFLIYLSAYKRLPRKSRWYIFLDE